MDLHLEPATSPTRTAKSEAAGTPSEGVTRPPILKAKYLAFKSGAYSCQVAVPVDLLEPGTKKQIRQAIIARLDECTDEEVMARCAQAAAGFRAEFKQMRAAKAEARTITPPAPAQPKVVSFPLTEEICLRAAATWASAEAADLERRRAICRERATSQDRASARALFVDEMRNSLRNAMDAQADECTDLATLAKAELETRHRVRLGDTECPLTELAQVLNAERVALLKRAIDVATGSAPAKDLAPPREDQLPLVELWGTDIGTALTHWVAKGDKAGVARLPRTLDKYQQIVRTFRPILGRRPLEATTSTDIYVFIAALRNDKNIGSTIATKLGILSSLMQPFDKGNVVCEFIDDARRALDSTSAERLTFTPYQLATLVHGIAGDPTVPSSHAQIVLLLALTGARLEEICQLRGSDIRMEPGLEGENYWLIQIASSLATGLGDAKVKTRQSNRRLPVLCGVLPTLDSFLTSCTGSNARLFPALRPDRYGTLSAAPSKLLNARIDDLLGTDKRLVLQGLRATAANTMRSANVDYAQRLRFLGHTANSVHTKHYEAAAQLDAYDLMPAAKRLAEFLRKALALRPVDSPSSQLGQSDWQPHSTHCVGEGAKRNSAVVASNGLADVPCQGVVNILGDAALPAQGLEGVPEAVKDQPHIGDAATVAMAKEARKDFSKVAPATAVVVRLKGGENPLLPRFQRLDVADEASLHNGGMQRNQAPRGDGFHPLLDAVANVQVPTMLSVVEDIGQPQLAELLQPTARDMGEHRDPSERVLAAPFWPEAVGINPRAENSLEVRLRKTRPLDGLDLGARDFHATRDVRRQVASVERALQHRVHKGKLFRHRRPGVASRQEVVSERRDVSAHQLRGGLSYDAFEVPRKALEFLDGARRPVRIQAPPIPKKGQHVRTVFAAPRGPVPGIRRGFQKRGNRVGNDFPGGAAGQRFELIFGRQLWRKRRVLAESDEPLGRKAKCKRTGGHAVVGLQTGAYSHAVSCAVRSRNAYLEPQGPVVRNKVGSSRHSASPRKLGCRKASLWHCQRANITLCHQDVPPNRDWKRRFLKIAIQSTT